MKRVLLFVLIGTLIVATLGCWVWLLGWLVTVIVGWFGHDLAVWQGIVIALVLNAIFGGGARTARS